MLPASVATVRMFEGEVPLHWSLVVVRQPY